VKPYNLLITGVGGQGTVVASDIVAAVGLKAGYDVKKSDVMGLAVRGGSVVSHVRWGENVHSPLVPEGRVDILVGFELLETLRWLDQLDPAGTVIVNLQRIFPVVVSSGLADYPSTVETDEALLGAVPSVYMVPGLDIARELGQTRTLNVVLLGALSALVDIDPQVWLDVIEARVPKKAVGVNLEAFKRGREVCAASRLVRQQAEGTAI